MKNLREMLDKLFNSNDNSRSYWNVGIFPVNIEWGILEKVDCAFPNKVEQNPMGNSNIDVTGKSIDLMIFIERAQPMFKVISEISKVETDTVAELRGKDCKESLEIVKKMDFWFYHQMSVPKKIDHKLSSEFSGIGEAIFENIARNAEGKELAAWYGQILYLTVNL